MKIRDLPSQPCAPYIVGRVGDRIAIAFNGLDFEPPIRVNAVAWVRGTPPGFVGIERISLGKVFSLVGLPPPDTATTDPVDRPSPPLGLLIATAAGVFAAGAALRRFSARPR